MATATRDRIVAGASTGVTVAHEHARRQHGRTIHDMVRFEVKNPSVRTDPWGYDRQLADTPEERVFWPKAEGGCVPVTS